MKQYHTSNSEAYDLEAKLKQSQEQKSRVESQAGKASKKFKNLEKQVEKVLMAPSQNFIKKCENTTCVFNV